MRHVAFLRGMNVGGHRLTNTELPCKRRGFCRRRLPTTRNAQDVGVTHADPRPDMRSRHETRSHHSNAQSLCRHRFFFPVGLYRAGLRMMLR